MRACSQRGGKARTDRFTPAADGFRSSPQHPERDASPHCSRASAAAYAGTAAKRARPWRLLGDENAPSTKRPARVFVRAVAGALPRRCTSSIRRHSGKRLSRCRRARNRCGCALSTPLGRGAGPASGCAQQPLRATSRHRAPPPHGTFRAVNTRAAELLPGGARRC